MRIDLNNDWRYYDSSESRKYEKVRLPHSNSCIPFNYINESDHQKSSGYEKDLYVEESWKNNILLLNFMAVAHKATVYINGKEACMHECGYTAFTVYINDLVEFGKVNSIAVLVDSREALDQPPFGSVIDYLTYGGIYREVFLEVKEKTYIKDVFVKASMAETEGPNFKADITLNREDDCSAICSITEKSSGRIIFTETVSLTKEITEITETIDKARNWDIDEPALYVFSIKLCKESIVLDEFKVTFGFRTAVFKEDGFWLNGRKVKIIGLNRHQSYPYAGYAMPKRVQENDALILKNELKVNAVRTSHYPQSLHFINKCDELGILVFTEIPGWQHVGGELWKETAKKNTREMVLEYRNHPSVILWGVRINESLDDDILYVETNRIAHELDDTRQTGGVRYIKNSHLLEDVYTYNDFSHQGTNRGIKKKKEITKTKAPYLITEFNGHMYPTKAFDDEAHRTEHALRHARVLDAVYGDSQVSGAFGWCMNDYNTHKDFGSGDSICYHGVNDMFRNAKYAAKVYACQSGSGPILEVFSSMDKGDREKSLSGGVWAVTNCDSIRMYRNDEFINEFRPDKTMFPNLPHPPVLIDDFTGDILVTKYGFKKSSSGKLKKLIRYILNNGPENIPVRYMLMISTVLVAEHKTIDELTGIVTEHIEGWGKAGRRYRFEAMKDGKTVKTVIKEAVRRVGIRAYADTYTLKEEETYDVASVRIEASDGSGNILPYCNDAITLVTEGPIELIGPDTVPLRGGYSGTYIKTTGREGKARLKLIMEGKTVSELDFDVQR
ncbi:MAG: glycoside hydrolase family 2 TIM barrel-domain containing protein [Clostridia bacterium]